MNGKRSGFILAIISVSASFAVYEAKSHLGAPSLAPVMNPTGTGTVVDQELEINWTDYDFPIPTGTATVDLFYTATNPAPNYRGQIPVDLQGDPVVTGILEKDTSNTYRWNTSTVAPGSYWIWSRVNEPEGEMNSGLNFIEFSPGVVTIAHPGDQVHPAIVVTRPNRPVAIAMDSYDVELSIFDPDQSGTITIEGALHETEDYHLIHQAAVTSSITSVRWDTSELENGDWKIRAKIEDARGLTFQSYSRFFVTVSHLLVPDAGTDAGTAPVDSGAPPVMTLDSGVSSSPPKPGQDACSCHSSSRKPVSYSVLIFLLLGLCLSWRCSKAA